MNARQKAKKLKKELDYIKNLPLRNVYRVTEIPTEHLKAYKVVPLIEIERYGKEIIENEVRLELSREIMKCIGAKIKLNTERDIDRFHYMKYSTDIFVGFGRSENK